MNNHIELEYKGYKGEIIIDTSINSIDKDVERYFKDTLMNSFKEIVDELINDSSI